MFTRQWAFLTHRNTVCNSVYSEPATISVSGSEAMLQDLHEIQLGSVDLSGMEEELTATYPIVLPEGITNLSERLEAAVTIQFVNLAVKEFEIGQLNVINVPEGMEAELMNQVLKVRLRGPSNVMATLKAEHISVNVDFSGKEIGSFTIKPTIVIQDEAYAKVGAVGAYSLSATLREKVVEATEAAEVAGG